MSAIVPTPPGSSTSRTRARVTISSGNSEVMTEVSRAGSFGAEGFSGIEVLPQDGAAHAQPDTHRGQAVADAGLAGELAGQLGHQPYAGARERGAERDRAAPRVPP